MTDYAQKILKSAATKDPKNKFVEECQESLRKRGFLSHKQLEALSKVELIKRPQIGVQCLG